MNVSHAASAPRDRPVLILKVGQTHDAIRARMGDFDDWIAAGLRQGGAHTVTVDPRHGAALPEPSTLAGIVVTGSHAMPTALRRPPAKMRAYPVSRSSSQIAARPSSASIPSSAM